MARKFLRIMPRLLNPEFVQRTCFARCFGKTTTNHLPGWFDKVNIILHMSQYNFYHIVVVYLIVAYYSQTIIYQGASSNQLEARPEGKEIYELQIDDVKPECWKKYIKHQGMSTCHGNISFLISFSMSMVDQRYIKYVLYDFR